MIKYHLLLGPVLQSICHPEMVFVSFSGKPSVSDKLCEK